MQWIQDSFLNVKDIGADKILLDAPCSGLGVLRRHPEGKWHKDATIVARMSEIQRELIAHSWSLLKAGGELIYAACSHEPEEGLDHLGLAKQQWGDQVEVVSPVSRLPDYFKRYVTRENALIIFSGNKITWTVSHPLFCAGSKLGRSVR